MLDSLPTTSTVNQMSFGDWHGTCYEWFVNPRMVVDLFHDEDGYHWAALIGEVSTKGTFTETLPDEFVDAVKTVARNRDEAR